MKRSIAAIMLLIAVPIFSREATTNLPDEELLFSPEKSPSAVVEPARPTVVSYERDAAFISTIDSVGLRVVLPPGEYFSVYVDAAAGTLGYSPQESPLDSALESWVIRAPENMQTQLRLNLADLDPASADLYIDVLASADPLWLDELFFCLANLAPEILERPELTFLLPENVAQVYKSDSVLNYVEIVDLGTPETPSQSTIARYFTTDTGMTGIDTIVLDSDMYYRYVMFPKITDELPLYISESTGDPVDPWSGHFWRTFFWDVTETAIVGAETLDCWALSDSLLDKDVLWNGIHNSDSDNGAIGVVTKWIKDCFVFDSDDERPHQPVRIYGKHMGRCGEHEDITTAAARAALIPCRNIESISTDHVWNEFWTGWRWAGWEPVNTYVDNQWVYADGWGKEFATVFEHRGDGFYIPVTDRYSHEISTVNMTAHDLGGRPIDGAKIMVAAASGTSIYYDCILFTDSRGEAVDLSGDAKHLYWRVDSEIGSNPAPGYVDNLVTNTVDGVTYNQSMSISGTMPHLVWSAATPTTAPVSYLGSRVSPVGSYLRHEGFFDDDETHYYLKSDAAYGFSLFALDDAEFARFAAGSSFAALGMVERTDFGGIEVPVDAESYWLVLANINNLSHTLVGDLVVALHDSSTAVPEADLPKALSLSVFPNPFNSTITIVFDYGSESRSGEQVGCGPAAGGVGASDARSGQVGIEIFDISGRLVADLPVTTCDESQVVPTPRIWQPDESVGSGVYFVRARFDKLSDREKQITKRVVYLK